MLLECVVKGKQDPEEAKRILGKVASELIKAGKIRLDFLDKNEEIKKS